MLGNYQHAVSTGWIPLWGSTTLELIGNILKLLPVIDGHKSPVKPLLAPGQPTSPWCAAATGSWQRFAKLWIDHELNFTARNGCIRFTFSSASPDIDSGSTSFCAAYNHFHSILLTDGYVMRSVLIHVIQWDQDSEENYCLRSINNDKVTSP